MKFDKCKVFNIEGAIRGMRNPKNSWHLSDSYFGLINLNYNEQDREIAHHWCLNDGVDWDSDQYDDLLDKYSTWLIDNGILDDNFDEEAGMAAYIGPKDMKLAKQLIAGGPEHRKFLRQIFVTVDITAPLFWFKEFDTYKVATAANSTSTMHKLTSKPITLDCFEIDDYNSELILEEGKEIQRMTTLEDEPISWKIDSIISFLEKLRQKYIETNDVRYWKELVRWLPEGWLQTRTWTGNYETLRSIYHQRKNHKLTEWHQFCDFIETLPYAKEFIME